MWSRLVPTFLYTDISPDIVETDVDVVSDLWEMDGREVYRGARDPTYSHANVHWLYDNDLQRVGCSEHSLEDHGDFRLLWFQESDFGTLLQEESWAIDGDLWNKIPRAPFERFLNEGWTTVESVLEQCLYGPTRLVTPQMLIACPKVYTCMTCGKKSLRKSSHCTMTESDLDFPQLEKVLFVDEDLVLHVPPPESSVFTRLRPQRDGGSQPALQEQAPEQEPVQEREQEPLQAPSPRPQTQPQQTPPEQPSPPQSHLRTPAPQSDAEEVRHERA